MTALDLPAARRVLDGLDDEQRAAVTAPLGPLRILAGAGTGKTRSLTHRIAYLHHVGAAPATSVLAVTHSAKAAAEMRERLADLGVPGVQARTFHAAALRQLSYFWDATGLPGTKPDIVADNRTLLRHALAAVQQTRPGAVASESVLTMASELAWARARMVTPADYVTRAAAAGRRTELSPALVADTFARYEADKRSRAVLDFDDVIAFCIRLLETNPQVATQVRAAYRSFVVDEYQDTDPAQQRLLDAWLGERDALTVVGDTSQAIYAFRGAETSLLSDFTSRYPHARTVSLVRDYRSTPQVVAAANRLMSTASHGALELVGQQPPGPDPRVWACADEDAEVRRIVGLVGDLVDDGVSPSQIAVLHRFNAQSAAIRAALSEAGLGVTVTAADVFFARPEVRSAVSRFTEAAAAEPDVDAVTLIAETLDAAGYDERTPPAGTGAARQRWDNQRELHTMVTTLAADGANAPAVAQQLRTRAEAESSGGGGVRVTTVHQAKGLEWDAVIVARATVGSLPSVFASTPAELAEERRLAYVATTRARHTLHVTWAQARDGRPTTPSPYLEDIAPGSTRTGSRAAGSGSRTARGRRTPAAAPPRPRVPLDRYTVGCRVTHDRFGLGTVTALTGARAQVDFGGPQTQTVHLDREPVEPL